MGGDAMKACLTRLGSSCFNPRPRMGGDLGNDVGWVGWWVSIHAPAWGATEIQGELFDV